jgi:hypothetical protein
VAAPKRSYLAIIGLPSPTREKPRLGPVRPPTSWYRRPAVVVLAALAVALVLSAIEANRAEHDAVPTQSTHRGMPHNDVGARPEDIVLSVVVAAVMAHDRAAALAGTARVSIYI